MLDGGDPGGDLGVHQGQEQLVLAGAGRGRTEPGVEPGVEPEVEPEPEPAPVGLSR